MYNNTGTHFGVRQLVIVNDPNVVRIDYLYKLQEAKTIKDVFSSWIGRQAHIGEGKIDTLRNIVIEPCDDAINDQGEKQYRVKFEFSNRSTFSASEFMKNNGLTHVPKLHSDAKLSSPAKKTDKLY